MPANLETQQLPQDWKRSVFTLIPKKGNAKECSNYCTFAPVPSTSLELKCIPFNSWVIFHCVYVPQFSYPFICWWTSRLLPCPGYYKQCCNEHWGTRVSYTLRKQFILQHYLLLFISIFVLFTFMTEGSFLFINKLCLYSDLTFW